MTAERGCRCIFSIYSTHSLNTMNVRTSVAVALFAAGAARVAATTPPVDFDRQVRPILSDNCFTCHGPDASKRMMGLHFDTKEGAFGKPGVIVPGDSAASKMYQRISNPKPRHAHAASLERS